MLNAYGAEVHFILEREYGRLYRAFGYINKNIAYAYSNIYPSKNIQAVADGASFDFVFVIHGETITEKDACRHEKAVPERPVHQLSLGLAEVQPQGRSAA